MMRFTWLYGALTAALAFGMYIRHVQTEKRLLAMRHEHIAAMTRAHLEPWTGWRDFWAKRKAEEFHATNG